MTAIVLVAASAIPLPFAVLMAVGFVMGVLGHLILSTWLIVLGIAIVFLATVLVAMFVTLPAGPAEPGQAAAVGGACATAERAWAAAPRAVAAAAAAGAPGRAGRSWWLSASGSSLTTSPPARALGRGTWGAAGSASGFAARAAPRLAPPARRWLGSGSPGRPVAWEWPAQPASWERLPHPTTGPDAGLRSPR